MSDDYISARTEENLTDLSESKKAMEEIIGEAWDKGYTLGRLKASEVKPESSWVIKEISNDLIKRNLAIAYATSGVVRRIDGEDWIKTSEVKQNLNDAPTVDTACPHCDSGYAQGYSDGYLRGKEERPQGEWIVKSNGTTNYYACNKCGNAGDIQDKFCRNCGADMRKGGAE